MNKKLLFLASPLLVLLVLVPVVNAAGYLHFKPEKDTKVPANHFLVINGTSAPSNATRTGCVVKFQTNGHGYKATTPLGPILQKDNASYYSKWSTTTGEMIKVGNNTLEAQIACFPLGGSTPNFIHHLVHNVTGI